MERKVFGLLVVDQGGGDTIMSASLERLLCWADPTCPVYNKGRNRFANQLEYSTIEILGGTPLEAAFCWTLACASALKGGAQVRASNVQYQVRRARSGPPLRNRLLLLVQGRLGQRAGFRRPLLRRREGREHRQDVASAPVLRHLLPDAKERARPHRRVRWRQQSRGQ